MAANGEGEAVRALYKAAFEDYRPEAEIEPLLAAADPAVGAEVRRVRARVRELYEAWSASDGPSADRDDRLQALHESDPLVAELLGPLVAAEGSPVIAPRTLPEGALKVEAPPGYEVLGRLGSGGMGVVYLARQLSLNRLVALKMILKGPHADQEERQQQRQRFQREAESVARLRHPNVVQVYEVGEHNDMPFLVLEYIDGGSLAGELNGQVLSSSRAAELVAALASAVEAAHQASVVHRDLKPANVLLDADGTPKVTDFGLAHWLDQAGALTGTNQLLGTPAYMAPEQVRRDCGPIGPATDVWALGVILYECLTGRPPFRGEDFVATMLQVVEQDPVPPSRLNASVARDVETICLKCLHKAPGRRYDTAAAVAEDLRRYLNNEPIRARPTGPLERAWKWARRSPGLAALAAAAVVALVSLVAVVVLQARASDALADKLSADNEAEKAKAARFEAETERKTFAIVAAEAQKKKAEAEARELKKEKEAEQLLSRAAREGAFQATLSAAKVTSEAGNWLAALPHFDDAIAQAEKEDRPERYSLAVDRLPGLIMHKDRVSTAREIERLAGLAHRLTPRDAARLDLLHGELLMSGNDLPGSRDLIGRALASRRLDPADEVYAAGLLCHSPSSALGYFRRAIALHRTHPRAHHALLATLLIRGQVEEVHRHAGLMRALFPGDPLPNVIASLGRLTAGEYDDARTTFDLARPFMTATRFADTRAFLDRFVDLHKLLSSIDSGNHRGGMLGLAPVVARFFAAIPQDEVPFSFNVPVAAWLTDRLTRLLEAQRATSPLWTSGNVSPLERARRAVRHIGPDGWHVRLFPPDPEGPARRAIRQLEPLCDDDGEPIVFVQLAFAKGSLALLREKAGDRTTAARLTGEVSDLYHRAADAPSLFPAACARYNSRVLALTTDDALLRMARESPGLIPDVVRRRRRFQDNLAAVLRDRERFPEVWEKLRSPGWLVNFSPNVVAAIIAHWQADAPNDPEPLRTYVRLLLTWRRYGEAFEQAFEALQLFPKDKVLTELFEKARKQHAENLKGLRPPEGKGPTKGP